jgi:hypothetical protein
MHSFYLLMSSVGVYTPFMNIHTRIKSHLLMSMAPVKEVSYDTNTLKLFLFRPVQ